MFYNITIIYIHIIIILIIIDIIEKENIFIAIKQAISAGDENVLGWHEVEQKADDWNRRAISLDKRWWEWRNFEKFLRDFNK